MKYSVKIIIPFYKETLKDWEKAALANNMEKLSNYPVVFLKPEGLNISSYEQACPQAETISVSTDWLGTKRGIAGYNELNSSYKCNGIHINNLFKFFVWCEVSKSFTRSII